MSRDKIRRLSYKTLEQLTNLNEEVIKIKNATCGIVHMGLGAFHKAHQAIYTQKAMMLDGGDWRIKGVSLRSPKVASLLKPQDCLYTVIEEDESGLEKIQVNAIDDVLVAPENPNAVIQELAKPNIKVVTLTITEKGYYHDPASGLLQSEHPEILHDLSNLTQPKTALGFLVSAIKLRVENQVPPFTVLSCDNLPSNGKLLKGLVLEFASLISTDLAKNIKDHYSFPCSMVDRIVPALTEKAQRQYSNIIGYDDQSLVITEPYSSWVIENDFVAGKPCWDKVGAQLVEDVESYEEMKLRLLNGSHSAIAYIGYLSGYGTVSEAISDESILKFVKDLMKVELAPTLSLYKLIDLGSYCKALIKRFNNKALHHKTYQIAMDGSQKLPQRLLAPLIQRRIRNDTNIERICFILAAWIQYTSGKDLNGNEIVVQDPFSKTLSAIADEYKNDIPNWVAEVFNISEVFDDALKGDGYVKQRVIYWLDVIRTNGSIKQSLSILYK